MVAPTIPLPRRQLPEHFIYIDALRGIAFLAVLMVHTAFCVGPLMGYNILSAGHYGVQLFFLVSSVTLCFSMAKRQALDRSPWLFFFIRRFFRIAPLFWMAIVIYSLFPEIIPRFWTEQWAPLGIQRSYYLLTAIFLHGWHPYTINSVVPGGWSIAVEMTFYAVFPISFRFIDTLKKAAIATLLCMLAGKTLFAFSFPKIHELLYPTIPAPVYRFFEYSWFPNQLPVFIMGFLLYYLLRESSIRKLAQSQFWSGCLLCFSIMALLSFSVGTSYFISMQLLVASALCGLVIALSGNRHRYITNPVLCYFGKISYSCYLVHFGALALVLKLSHISLTGEVPVFDAGSPMANLLLFLKLYLSALAITAVISTITYHAIEKPGMALGQKVCKWLEWRKGSGF